MTRLLCGCKQALACSLQQALGPVLVSLCHSCAPVQLSAVPQSTMAEMLLSPSLQHGRTEYKSVTIADNSTAQEFMDFYLNDPTRQQWVSTPSPAACPL